jgi:hypothetical protein
VSIFGLNASQTGASDENHDGYRFGARETARAIMPPQPAVCKASTANNNNFQCFIRIGRAYQKAGTRRQWKIVNRKFLRMTMRMIICPRIKKHWRLAQKNAQSRKIPRFKL